MFKESNVPREYNDEKAIALYIYSRYVGTAKFALLQINALHEELDRRIFLLFQKDEEQMKRTQFKINKKQRHFIW